MTRKDSKCQRKASDNSDLCQPSEGFNPIFEPSDETMEHRLLVAEAATGERCNKLVSGLIIENMVIEMLPLDTIDYRFPPKIICFKIATNQRQNLLPLFI